ncbi:hypothetical protein KM427_12520 [Nocardioides sp. LMS-CY]|uniref:hypothetical protein n=1 Tax=Nocardioides sp. (strain LMS-CY) TaxID=2840457 RepID=UPI001BFFDF3C|nr:hypothetical protein [Nocardioides sp. LMS-CY]QWF24440.1 hypothetical protein KM427_12520 [Nocardioides sp. LMS-CY]
MRRTTALQTPFAQNDTPPQLPVCVDVREVEEVRMNDPSRVFVARNVRPERTNLMLSREQVNELVDRMLKSSGRQIDLSPPFVDAAVRPRRSDTIHPWKSSRSCSPG